MADMNEVVKKVALLADKDRIPWKTTADQSAFAATFGGMSVLISLQLSTEGNHQGGINWPSSTRKGMKLILLSIGQMLLLIPTLSYNPSTTTQNAQL